MHVVILLVLQLLLLSQRLALLAVSSALIFYVKTDKAIVVRSPRGKTLKIIIMAVSDGQMFKIEKVSDWE